MIDAALVLSAFRSDGFAEIDLPEDLAHRLVRLAQWFYAKPIEERLATAAFRTSGVLGYYPSELAAKAIREEYCGAIPTFEGKRARGYCSYDLIANERILAASDLFGANLWPADKEFRVEAWNLYETICQFMKHVSQSILGHVDAIGKLNQLPSDTFDQECCSIMRLLKYAAGHVEKESKAHTDYEFISLIKSNVQGLQVRNASGTWGMAPCGLGRAVILPGDMLEVATDGWVESSLHRVRVGEEDRLSIIFFQGIGLQQEITYSIRGETIRSTFGKHLSAMLVRGAPHLQTQLHSWQEKLGINIPDKNPFGTAKEAGNIRA
jgi:isopenicillin N synthase-like dioxygenase